MIEMQLKNEYKFVRNDEHVLYNKNYIYFNLTKK